MPVRTECMWPLRLLVEDSSFVGDHKFVWRVFWHLGVEQLTDGNINSGKVVRVRLILMVRGQGFLP